MQCVPKKMLPTFLPARTNYACWLNCLCGQTWYKQARLRRQQISEISASHTIFCWLNTFSHTTFFGTHHTLTHSSVCINQLPCTLCVSHGLSKFLRFLLFTFFRNLLLNLPNYIHNNYNLYNHGIST